MYLNLLYITNYKHCLSLTNKFTHKQINRREEKSQTIKKKLMEVEMKIKMETSMALEKYLEINIQLR